LMPPAWSPSTRPPAPSLFWGPLSRAWTPSPSPFPSPLASGPSPSWGWCFGDRGASGTQKRRSSDLSVWLLSPTRDAIICTRTRSAMTQAADPHQLRRDQWIARVAALADEINGWCQSLGCAEEVGRKAIGEEMVG